MRTANTTQYNIPIQLSSIGNYSIDELREKLMAYALTIVGASEAADMPTEVKSKHTHSDWVKSMAKYRILNRTDYKKAMLESLDERFG